MYLPISPALCTLLPLALCPHNLPATLFLPTSQSSHSHLPSSASPCLLKRLRLLWFFFLSLVFLFLITPCPLGEKSPYTWQRYGFSPTWQLFFISSEHHRATCPSCWSHQLSLPQLCPKESSMSGCEGLSGTLEHHLITPHVGMVQPLLSYQYQSSYLSLHSQHNVAH